MKFRCKDVPVAYSMVKLVRHLPDHEFKPFQVFMCYWLAFNNIYTIISDLTIISDPAKLKPELEKKNGKLVIRKKAGMQIVKVTNIPTERKKIFDSAYNEFSDDLKDELIKHESTNFFLDREPKYEYSKIPIDGFGQSLNGVINVGLTIDPKYPCWSPLNKDDYKKYKSTNDSKVRDELAKQILDVLYTVRNNIFHAGKRDDDADDLNVVMKAVPLLEMIVLHLLDKQEVIRFAV